MHQLVHDVRDKLFVVEKIVSILRQSISYLERYGYVFIQHYISREIGMYLERWYRV